MIYEKIADYDIRRLERIVKQIARKELRRIEALGGILGFIIGCVQVAVICITGIVTV